MNYLEKEFHKKYLLIEGKKTHYYLSPILEEYGFIHAFFTKNSSEIELKFLSNHFQKDYKNCFNNQMHSNKIIFGSETNPDEMLIGDGLISDQTDQNLWIYTADCMPILVADFKKKIVASLHCGRKGLEKKIIKKLIRLLKNLGCNKRDLLIAIGPTISSKKYFVDKSTYYKFYKNINSSNICMDNFPKKNFYPHKSENKIQIDLKKYAYYQLINENIHSTNIDISNKCTYISHNEFHSYRKTKTHKRQWSFISN